SVADSLLLAAVAAPAPTARYSFGPVHTSVPRMKTRGMLSLVLGIGAGLAIGIAGVLAWSHRAKPAVVAASPAPTSSTVLAPTSRRIVVTLPFLATQVELDGAGKTLSPAADVAVFEVAPDAPKRHKLVAIALDGTRAEGF